MLKKKHEEQLEKVFNSGSQIAEAMQPPNFVEPEIPDDPLHIEGTPLGTFISSLVRDFVFIQFRMMIEQRHQQV